MRRSLVLLLAHGFGGGRKTLRFESLLPYISMILVATDETVNEILGALKMLQEYVVGLLGQQPYNGGPPALGL
jgi:hypothetical protein